MRELVILGSTGSIGTQALDVVARNPDRFRVVGLAATGRNAAALAAQAGATGAQVVAVSDAGQADAVREALRVAGAAPKLLVGPHAVDELAGWPADTVLNAIDGTAGLLPTLAALSAGRTVALANKESLVIGGPLVRRAAAPGQLVAVDSEHSALAQCLRSGTQREVRRLILTASGGPFRGRDAAAMATVTPAQALSHPTWQMGPLVTVNSATLVNKGLESIEAHLLFDVDFDAIAVVVHPQSIVHSMVEFTDGSTIAQLSPPDMRLPISLAMGWPERVPDAAPALDFASALALEFEPLDHTAFPAVELAASAGRAAGTAPAVFTAANEECVAAFLAGQAPFGSIVATTAAVLGSHEVVADPDLDAILAAVAWARREARARVGTP